MSSAVSDQDVDLPRRRVALIAFGCSPGGGSEHRAGWHWATSLAEAGVELTVFAHSVQRHLVEGRPEAEGIEFVWVDAEAPKIADLRPAYRSSIAYLAFLKACETPLRQRHVAEPFSAGLHVSWSQIRSGTPLAEIDDLPFVFGPVGGGHMMPFGLARRYLGTHALVEGARNLHVQSTRLNLRARRSCQRAELVVAANAGTESLARSLGARRVVIMTDGGLTELPGEPEPLPPFDEGLRLLWVGRLMPRKGLKLALDALRLARLRADVRLTILGDGEDRSLLEAPIEGVEWRGQVPPSDLPSFFADHHLNLFPSLRESGGPPVVEAIGFGRPSVCLDHQGPAAIIDAACGVLVDPVPEGLAERLADALVDLALNPSKVVALAAGTKTVRTKLLQKNRTKWMVAQLDEAASRR